HNPRTSRAPGTDEAIAAVPAQTRRPRTRGLLELSPGPTPKDPADRLGQTPQAIRQQKPDTPNRRPVPPSIRDRTGAGPFHSPDRQCAGGTSVPCPTVRALRRPLSPTRVPPPAP